MGTYLSTPVTEKGQEQSDELHCPITPCAWGVVDMQGWRKSMEDAHVARTNVDIPEHLLLSSLQQNKIAAVKKNHANAKAKVFGVFDGHGGPEVARFCQLYLVSVLTHQPTWTGQGQEAGQALVSNNNNTAAAAASSITNNNNNTDVVDKDDADADANNNNNNNANNLSDVGKALRMCFHALDRLIDDPSRREELVRLRAIKPGPGEYRDIDHVDHIPPPVELVGEVSSAAAPPANANNDDDNDHDDIPAGVAAAAAKEEDNGDDDEADATTTTSTDDYDEESPSLSSPPEDKRDDDAAASTTSAATATADTAAASEQENVPHVNAKSEEKMNDDSSNNSAAVAKEQEESSASTRPSTNETSATNAAAAGGVESSDDDALAAKMQEEEEEEAKKDAVDDDMDDNEDVAAASDYSDDSEQAVGLDEAAELDRDLMDEDDDDENAEASDTSSSTAPVMIMDDENDGGEIEHTPLPPPPPVPESPQSMGTAGKVSTMFQRLLNLSGTPPAQGQVAVDLNHSSGSSSAAIIDATSPPPPPPPPPLPPGAKTNGPCASLPTIVQNGRMICNLPDHPIHAGATAIVAVICGKTLTVANAGDSRAVLCRQGGQAMALSFDHKPQQDTELTRIHRAGGFVNHFGRVNGNLNLSRSIGDLKYKQVPGIRPRDQMISAEPDIVEVQLQDDDEFIILGCDGIWDCLSNEQAVDYVRRRIHVQTPTEIGVEMLDEIISTDPRVTQGIGGDNMTLMIIDLQPHSRSYRKASSGSPHTTGGDGDGGGDASSNKNNLDEEASSRL